MKLLAVDSGGAQAGFAAFDSAPDLRARGMTWLEDSRELSRQVVLCLDRALAEAGWTQDDIGAVALAAGPGSWTGLRIGFSACKTLAQVRCLPLITVPTYDAIAGAAWRSGLARDQSPGDRHPSASDAAVLAVVGHCRAGYTYLKLFRCQSSAFQALGGECIVPITELADRLGAAASSASEPSSVFVTGPARETVAGLLARRAIPATLLEPGRDAVLVELGRLALAALQAGDVGDPLAAQPLYLAPSAAERVLREQRA